MFYDNDDDDGGYKGFSSYTIHTFAIERHVCALSSIEVTVFIVVAATYRRSRRVYKYTSLWFIHHGKKGSPAGTDTLIKQLGFLKCKHMIHNLIVTTSHGERSIDRRGSLDIKEMR